MFSQVSCETCISACCRQGVIMPLTEKEAAFMEAGGTILAKKEQPVSRRRLPLISARRRSPERATQDHKLMTDCGYLAVNETTGESCCSVHESPDRPAVCADFKANSFGCLIMRVQADIDTAQEFANRMDALTGGINLPTDAKSGTLVR